MLLPTHFKTYDAYFHEILLFLQNVSWLFDFPITQMLSQDIFSKIPSEWKTPLLSLSNEELNLFPTGFVKKDWPSSLIHFQEQCQRFTLPVLTGNSKNHSYVSRKDIPNEIWRGMTPKKKIEVELLSSLVQEECQLLNISRILDVGSGHGYVDRLLLMHGFKILGIETNLKMITYTINQLEKTFKTSLSNSFKFIQLNIDSNSSELVKKEVRKYFIPLNQSGNEINHSLYSNGLLEYNHLQKTDTNKDNLENISMIGLHACGDLAVNAMKLFLNLSEIKSLIMVPCCYHKMLSVNGVRNIGACNVNRELSYWNFPVSETVKNNIADLNSFVFLQGPFLRLAGQATKSLWQNYSEKDHENHSFHVLSRAIVQLYCVQEGRKVEKSFRRVVKKSVLDLNDFSAYVNETLERCTISSTNESLQNNSDVEQVRKKLLRLWEQHNDKLKLVEVITGLQMCVESVAESFIAADRACFLFENGIKDVRLVKLFDSIISPRGLVYLATKTIK